MKKVYISPSLDIIEGFANPIMGETSWKAMKNNGDVVDGGKIIEETPTGGLELDANRTSLWDE